MACRMKSNGNKNQSKMRQSPTLYKNANVSFVRTLECRYCNGNGLGITMADADIYLFEAGFLSGGGGITV